MLGSTVEKLIVRTGLLLFCVGTCFLHAAIARAEEKPQISVPSFDDRYSKLVRHLESGQTDIDYRELRESFLESKQFRIAASKRPELDRLQHALSKLMFQSKFPEIIQTTQKILSIDYTNMRAHKVLYQTAQILKDQPTAHKHHDIEMGLLTSIVRNGDGKSCKTAWPVVQVEEEYFILEMLDATVESQSVDNKGGLCDRMEVATEKGKAVYYFSITKVFEGRARLLDKN